MRRTPDSAAAGGRLRIEVSFPDGEKRIHHTAHKHGAAVIATSFGTFHLDGGGVYRWLGCRSVTARFVGEGEAGKKLKGKK